MDGGKQPFIPSHPFRWVPEFVAINRRRWGTQGRLFGPAVLVGIIAGLGAMLFSIACQFIVYLSLDNLAGYRAQGPKHEARVGWMAESEQPFRPWMLLVVPVLGGLVSGYIVFKFAPEAEGHGTDSVIDAYHNKQGHIRPRVPLIKLLASAITIGTGGSGGREGPIAQIGAGFGSLLGKLLSLRPVERRILLAAGMGAGIAAIFRAPLAGALFAAEVLYRSPEFEPEVIMPACIASVVGYSVSGPFFGWTSLFETPDLRFENAGQLLVYAILALLMALLAMVYTRTFYGVSHLFRKLPLPRMFRPAVGAFLAGAIGLALYFAFGSDRSVLAVLSFGYGILQEALSDPKRTSAILLLAVALGKILTTSVTIGSGGSGGVFGPSMVIGGCAGGAFGVFLHHHWEWLAPHPSAFIIVGMAGFFAAAAKTPFSTLIIVSELTGDYRLILPALWVCALAYLLSDEQSLYQSQVESRSRSPAHQGDYVRDVLLGRKVIQVLSQATPVEALHPDDPLERVIERFDATRQVVLPVIDAEKRLLGVIHLHELYWTANRRESLPWLLAVDLMRSSVKPLRPDDPLERAVELFAENDLPELPVVCNAEKKFLGMVRRTDIARAYLHHVHGPSTPASPDPII
jgi:CIC family chloride channel protein